MNNNYNPLNNNPNDENESEIKRKLMIAKIASAIISIFSTYIVVMIITSPNINIDKNSFKYMIIGLAMCYFICIFIHPFLYLKYKMKHIEKATFDKEKKRKHVLVTFGILFIIIYIIRIIRYIIG